jgi:hypothetical protein
MQSRLSGGVFSKLTDGPRTNADLSRTGAGASRGANQGKKLNAAPWSGTWPAPGATLDLDFANDRGFVRGVGQGRSMDAVTFTRASNGNYVKPDGTLSSHANQGALGNNLLTFPQDFDNAAWSATGTVSITKDSEIAPDGTLTADILDHTGDFSGLFRGNSITSGTTYTASIYYKYISGQTNFRFRLQNVFAATIELVVDVVTNTIISSSDVTNVTFTASANGFTRLSFSATATSTGNGNLVIYRGGSGQARLAIWGAQLEVGSTATEYFPTNINTPRFDWASTAQVAQRNLLRFTEQFDNSYWSPLRLSITANSTSAPDGTTTAETITATASAGNHKTISSSVAVGSSTTMTASAYIKENTLNYASLVVTNQTANWAVITADLNTGTITKTGNSNYTILSSSIVDAGDGWYRLILTFVSTTAGSGISISLNNTDNPTYGAFGVQSWTSSGTESVFIWGAQLEIGDTATTYQAISVPTTNTPLAANPTSNGLLIEEARTNRLLWNRDATDAAWVKTDVTAAKDQTGIDGVANAASSLTASADNGACIQTITLASGSRTGSVFLKRITGTGNVQVSLDGSTWSTVDLSDTEWRRIALSGTVTNPTVGIRLAISGDAVAMDYGQVEDGAFATSPILTTTASVTRSADAATMSGSNFFGWCDQSKGTAVSSFQSFGGYITSGRIGLHFVVLGSQISPFIQNSTTLRIPSSSVIDLIVPTTINAPITIAYSYQNNNFSGYATNSTIKQSFNGTVPIVTTVAIGSFNGSSNFINGTIKRLVYFPKVCTPDALVPLEEATR